MTVQLTAKDLAFDRTSFTVPADVTFAVELNNQDGVPHNVDIKGNGQSRSSEPFSGPATKTLVLAGLPAGTYTFVCSIHTDMNGTVQVTAADSTP
jgi:plastocyanin